MDNTINEVGENIVNADWKDCITSKVNLNNAGEFIKKETAVAYLGDYLASIGRDSHKDPDHVFGFLYGLDKVLEFCGKIAKYNQTADGDQRIVAVRIYHAISTRVIAGSVPPERSPLLRDAIIVPVLATGEDLYKIMPLFGDEDIILAESRPCPNQCGVKFIDE